MGCSITYERCHGIVYDKELLYCITNVMNEQLIYYCIRRYSKYVGLLVDANDIYIYISKNNKQVNILNILCSTSTSTIQYLFLLSKFKI